MLVTFLFEGDGSILLAIAECRRMCSEGEHTEIDLLFGCATKLG